MDMVVDNFFKESYELYFSNLHDTVILEEINNVFTKYDPELVIDTINIIKVAMSLNLVYTECYERVVGTILKKFPMSEDIDKFILCVTVKIMISRGSSSINDILVRTRNIHKEVASKYFKIPVDKVTDLMIDRIKNLKETQYSFEMDKKLNSWDEYFYNVCVQVARNTKCFSRRIGSVLVYDKSIISTGYNGPPRGVPSCDMRWKIDPDFIKEYVDGSVQDSFIGQCPRRCLGFKSGEGLELCPAGHAERNSLINAARNGIKTKNTTMYMTCGVPCTPCLVEIINAGVKEIVVTSLKSYDKTAMYLLNQSKLLVRLFDFIDI